VISMASPSRPAISPGRRVGLGLVASSTDPAADVKHETGAAWTGQATARAAAGSISFMVVRAFFMGLHFAACGHTNPSETLAGVRKAYENL